MTAADHAVAGLYALLCMGISVARFARKAGR